MAKELKDRTQEEPYIHQTPEGYIRFYRKVYVPLSEVLRILKQEHDAPGSGHKGITKTWQRIRARYYFPQMKQKVKEYINKCQEC